MRGEGSESACGVPAFGFARRLDALVPVGFAPGAMLNDVKGN